MSLVLSALPRPRDVLSEFGLYVHIPFCVHRCWYCDFNAYAGLDHLADAYMHALVSDIESAHSAPSGADLDVRPVVTSVFIGGGTPSLVDASHIARVMHAVRGNWDLAPGAEVTIECNPESTTPGKLHSYLDAGVNRVSFGVQSLDGDLLERLGRTHDARTALTALHAARSSGFDDVSADLIFGIPGEDDRKWKASLEGVLACEPTHVSCYALTYEEGTPLHAWLRIGRVVPEGDDDVARRWEIADRLLASSGFARYEISNWARPGRGSRHNALYWKCGEYLGVGAGAHSHLAGEGNAVRSWTLRGPDRYTRAVRERASTVASFEEIDARTRASEVMMLGLRRPEGVAAADFEALVGRAIEDVFSEELAASVGRGLVSRDGEVVRVRNPLLADDACSLFA